MPASSRSQVISTAVEKVAVAVDAFENCSRSTYGSHSNGRRDFMGRALIVAVIVVLAADRSWCSSDNTSVSSNTLVTRMKR